MSTSTTEQADRLAFLAECMKQLDGERAAVCLEYQALREKQQWEEDKAKAESRYAQAVARVAALIPHKDNPTLAALLAEWQEQEKRASYCLRRFAANWAEDDDNDE